MCYDALGYSFLWARMGVHNILVRNEICQLNRKI